MASRNPHHFPAPTGLLLLGLLLAGTGCEINKPEMPSFDSTFVLPLGTERLEVMDAIDDEQYLQVAADGGLAFHLDGDPDTLALAFDFSVEILAQTIDQGLGDFALPPAAPLAYRFELGDIWAPAAGVDGMATVVPAFPIDLTSGGQDLPDVTSATVSSGTLTVTVTNGLAVPVSADSGPDQLVLQLLEPTGGTPVTWLSFDRLAPGQTAVRQVDLAGVVLPDQLAVHLQGGSPGSGGQLVTITGTDAISVEAVFGDLVVSSATAVVADQTFDTQMDTALPADYEVSRAVIASGAVGVDLRNDMPVPCTVTMVWGQVRNLDGDALTRTFDLAPGGSSGASLDFGGYIVQAAGTPLTSLNAEVSIVTPGSGGLPVALDSGDGLSASLAASTIVFSSVTGVVPSSTVPLEPITENIDLPEEMNGLELTAAQLTLRVTNSAAIPADVALTLDGTSTGGTVRSLLVNEQILPAVGRAATVTTIVLDQNNSSILEFLNNLPETITLAGEVVAGGGAAGTVHSDDFAVVGWEIGAPVEVVINDATIEGEPSVLDIGEDLRNAISDHARGALLRAEIRNHLPLTVELRIIAAADTNQLATQPLLAVGPITVAAGQVDPATHTVVEAATSFPTIALDEAQARVFGRAGLVTQVLAFLPATDGRPVRVLATDYLEFEGVVDLEVMVDDDF